MLKIDFAEKPASGEKLGGALLAAPETSETPLGAASDSPPGANPAKAGFSAKSKIEI